MVTFAAMGLSGQGDESFVIGQLPSTSVVPRIPDPGGVGVAGGGRCSRHPVNVTMTMSATTPVVLTDLRRLVLGLLWRLSRFLAPIRFQRVGGLGSSAAA